MTDTRRPIRTYVLRTGRMTTGQRRAFERDWPDFGLEVREGAIDTRKVFGNDNPLAIEIGFGMGDSLVEMAVDNPSTNFIGIEVHRPGVGHLLRLAREAGISNLRVYCADAIEVLEQCIQPSFVDRIQILFPDPWPKKRHHKRRLINAAFGALLESRLRPGGVLHIATDWAPYGDQIIEILSGIDGLRAIAPPARPVTKYERRGRRLGHDVRELAFEKTAAVC